VSPKNAEKEVSYMKSLKDNSLLHDGIQITFLISILEYIIMATSIQQAFVVDGKSFATKQEALDYIRLPKITEAFNALNENNAELTAWLISNENEIKNVFSKDSSRRVTTKERAALADALAAVEAGFLHEHAEAIKASFKWPAVAKLAPEAAQAKVQSTLSELLDGNVELINWIIANETAIIEAYSAGVEKREVSEKAAEGLAAYQARVTAQQTSIATQDGKLDILEAIRDKITKDGLQGAEAAKALGHDAYWKDLNTRAKAAAKIVPTKA
jgi:hypothetical protein